MLLYSIPPFYVLFPHSIILCHSSTLAARLPGCLPVHWQAPRTSTNKKKKKNAFSKVN